VVLCPTTSFYCTPAENILEDLTLVDYEEGGVVCPHCRSHKVRAMWSVSSVVTSGERLCTSLEFSHARNSPSLGSRGGRHILGALLGDNSRAALLLQNKLESLRFNFLGVLIYGQHSIFEVRRPSRKGLFVFCADGSVFLSRTLMAGSFAVALSARRKAVKPSPRSRPQPQPVTHDF